MKRLLFKKTLLLFSLVLSCVTNVMGQVTEVLVYDIANGDDTTAGETVHPNLLNYISASNLSAYPLDIGYGAALGMYLKGFSETIDLNKYFHFSITPNSGVILQNINYLSFSLGSEDLAFNAPNQGPEMFEIRASTDSFATFVPIDTISLVNFFSPRSHTDTSLFVSITDFSMLGPLNTVSEIEFRIYPYDIGGASGNLRLGGLSEKTDMVFSVEVLLPSPCYNSASFNYIDNGSGDFSTYSTSINGSNLLNSWDFGDGPGSLVSNYGNDTISYIYTSSGNYMIKLIVQDTLNYCSDSISQGVNYTVQAPCQASFTYLANGQIIDFTSTSISDSSAIVNFWNFGDGFIYNTDSVDASHNYTAGGAYNVSLSMLDTLSGCTDTVIQVVNVPFPNPGCVTPSFTYYDNTDGTVSLYNSSPLGYNSTWDMGDGSFNYTTELTAGYNLPGTYYVCLTINDSCNSTFCDSVTVTGANIACSGSAAFTFIDNGGGSVSFVSSDTRPTDYSWDFGDGLGYSTLASPIYTYPVAGNYIVELTTFDSIFQCTTSTPKPIVVAVNSNACGLANFTSNDNGGGLWSFASTSGGQPTAYSWNFGDGVHGSVSAPNHTYQVDGVYVVSLTIFDSILACSNSTNAIVSVVGASGGNTCNSAFVITFDTIQSSVIVYNTSTGTNLNYLWDFGDGNLSNQENPNYNYGGNGPYQLCLTVDDGAGCTSTYCDSIFSGGTVLKQAGFSIDVVRPVVTGLVSEMNADVSTLDFYPNPATNELTINFFMKEPNEVEMFVTDILGNIVVVIVDQKMAVGNNQVKWDVTSLKNGLYFLNFKENKSHQIKKFVVNR